MTACEPGRKQGKRRVIIAVLVVLVLVLAAAALLWVCSPLYIDPYRGTVQSDEPSLALEDVLTGEQAREDLDYLMTCLRERHPAWLDGSGKDAVAEEAYQQARSSIGDEISVLEFYRLAAGVAASLRDAHTTVSWRPDPDAPYYYIDTGVTISQLGLPLTINGVPSEEVLAAYKSISSFELDEYIEHNFWTYGINYEPVLRTCGVDTSNGVDMTFRTETGVQTIHFDFAPLEGSGGYPKPDYIMDARNNTAVFTLTSCVYDEEYCSTVAAFFRRVDSFGIENVIVDLRGNTGGNSLVANEFLRYLDVDQYRAWDCAVRYGWYLKWYRDQVYVNDRAEPTFDGSLYVLTDLNTFSSGMDFAMLVADNDLGTLVGEPCGNLPDSYGDLLRFLLPNSKLRFNVSYKKWCRIDQEKAGEPITPDVLCPSEDALNRAYELIQGEA